MSTNKTQEKELNSYNPGILEKKWQSAWKENSLYKTKEPKSDQKKFYALSMFPYPSGNLHMGHVRNYVITDVIARHHRMTGYAVLHPMGWDAFGLPAENAAIDRGIEADIWTDQNIKQMKSQLDKLGLSIDWDKEITTCKENYYKWTQYLFLELLDSKLAYQKSATVNWDPIDQTVLANEQVDSNGRSWRSGAKVERKKLKQWFLKITDYAEDLLTDLNKLKGWPDNVKTMQRNWIGKSVGTEIIFKVRDLKNTEITVFTTRPDTLYGANYICLAPDHPLVDKIVSKDNKLNLDNFRKEVNKLTDQDRTSDSKSKKGIPLGVEAINPINNKFIPIWVADYVLASYATGSVMGVPGHDERDYKFAKKYSLPITYVIKDKNMNNMNELNSAYTLPGIIINSNDINGKSSTEAKEIITSIGIKQNWAQKKISYKLRDWLISRQRYWGCPIPVVHCRTCGVVPIDQNELPIKLNKPTDNKPKDNIICPKCRQNAVLESDTMDTFMCSSWYFLRYIDSNNSSQPFNKELANKWMPVNQYVGGVEHAILHLLYSRFLIKALKKRGLIDIDEPFENLLTQGMVQGITYRNPNSLKYIAVEKITDINNPLDPETGEPLEIIYEKMSKSKYNGVDPEKVINKYGTDTARMFILFKAPPEKDLEWDDSDVEGQFRFLNRVWRLIDDINNNKNINLQIIRTITIPNDLNEIEKKLRRTLHNTIKEVTNDLKINNQFNTAISELMILTNTLYDCKTDCRQIILNESLTNLTLLLAPFAPHLAEEFWFKLNGNGSVHEQSWPLIDERALILDSYKLVIQINGKVRGYIMVNTSDENEILKEKALSSDIAQKWLNKDIPKRVIVVKGKLVNIVI